MFILRKCKGCTLEYKLDFIKSCFKNNIEHILCIVTGQANVSVERTSLVVGGFTQPTVARGIIEGQAGAQRGFSQRFLWIFPKPVFGHLETITGDDQEESKIMG